MGSDCGLVVGTLFSRDTYARVRDINAEEFSNIVTSGGARLIEKYWGGFVAIIKGNPNSKVLILRDPSGFLPCYQQESANHFFWASDLAAFSSAGIRTDEIDWNCLFEHLQSPDTRRAATCINGLSELPPGTVSVIDGEHLTERRLWRPWSFTDPSQALSPQASIHELRESICRSVSALAGAFRHVVVGVSGGLDSSIVCAALGRGGHRFSCLTLATDDPSGDERKYAASVATATGASLSARIYELAAIDVRRSSSAHLPRPNGKPFMQELERAYRFEIEAYNADAIFTGNGGDNVFCYLHSATPIVDRLHFERRIAKAWRTLLDMCAITQCDVPTMARATLSLLRHPEGALNTPSDQSFLNHDRGACSESHLLNDYFTEAPTRYPGKIAHVQLLTRIQNFVEGYDRSVYPSVIAPLLAQPVVETCLRIPTWVWCDGGINRSAARRAFSGFLPRQVTRRTAKSGPDSFTAAVFERNKSTVRELLLGGLLRHHNIIDPLSVELALSDSNTGRGQLLYRLLDIVDAEAWARERSSAELPAH